jgi:CheY-like chemotaxis protein
LLGYSVVSSLSSPEALKTFTENPNGFDVVITDFTMPYMTGYELAKEFLRIRPDIPIILCTGFSSQISEEQARAAGIRAFIMKPYNTGEIAAALRKVLPSRQPTAEQGA